ncbi:hypothetical protein FA13DRAFT_1408938 [Coprinellus micaceus]|uniref:Uncharacterized protein n=1 Tax=Coprinellus micaceus TaxID=71717 RepID=A0A4Y7SPA0_COPMI|nr:hypothetical protein FA13DRAFT_1408938 [Coprinellus micaceus]
MSGGKEPGGPTYVTDGLTSGAVANEKCYFQVFIGPTTTASDVHLLFDCKLCINTTTSAGATATHPGQMSKDVYADDLGD